MGFVASASRILQASPELCFRRVLDFGSWRSWMPASFRPLRGPEGALRLGDVAWVRIGRAPLPARIEVVRIDPAREIAWRGGLRGVLEADHAFLFDDTGQGTTRVRSSEVWTGVLSGVVARLIRPIAERIAAQELAALAACVEQA